MGSIITGTGIAIPERVITNHDLARVMDTSDEWIRTRTGVAERRLVEEGTGSATLGAAAGTAALADAGVEPQGVDALITATMTPDFYAPGIAGLVQHEMGLGAIAAFDIRQQCGGFLYGLDLADSLLRADKAGTVLVVGTEVHAGFLPFGPTSWANLTGSAEPPTAEEWDYNTAHRAWSVLFGDGAGAAVLQRSADDSAGLLGAALHTDGAHFELIHVPGVGFRSRPYVDAAAVAGQRHVPVMNGAELFRQAVRRMPQAVREVTEQLGMAVEDLDLVIAHQANERITDGVRRSLGLSAEVVPSNISRYGNTTAATLPILYHELRQQGKVRPGSLVCFTTFGAGAHWGAALYREPS